MPPAFYSSGSADGGYACPVFAVAWLGADSTEVFYAGGGGATKSGVANKVVLATVVRNAEPLAPPSFKETSSLLTADQICTTAHAGPVAPGNVQLVAGGLFDALMFYGVTAGRELVPLSAGVVSMADGKVVDVTTVAFDRSGGRVVAAGDSKGVVRLYRIENLDAVLAALAAKTTPPPPPAAAQGKGAASAAPPPIFTPAVQLSPSVKLLAGHSDAVTAVHFDAQGLRVCSASKDGTCRVWDVASGKELAVLPTTSGLPPAYAKNKMVLKQMCRSCLFSPVDDCIVYTLQNASRGSSYVTKWKLTDTKAAPNDLAVSFEPLRVGLICGSPVPCMDVRPDGTHLIAGDTQGIIHIIDADSLKKRASYDGHQLPVSSISLAALQASGTQVASYDIVSGSGDKTIILGSSEIVSTGRGVSAFLLLLFLALVAALVACYVANPTSYPTALSSIGL